MLTQKRSGLADPQRTIFQLDHRGRILRSWDPEQVFLMGLHGPGVAWNSSTFLTLQANIDRSYEYTLKATQRDSYGRITGEDFGERLTLVSPDPDKLAATNGPKTRQTTTITYVNNNPVTSKEPIQAQETYAWNDTFDVLTQQTDETGRPYFQTVNPTNGLVTQQRWGERPLWQNPDITLDADRDGGVSPLDVLAIINYTNSFPGASGSPVPNGPPPAPYFYYLDVDGDNYVGPLDVLAVTGWLNATTFTMPPVVNSLQQVDYTYATNATLPKGLVETQTIKTGRSEGDHIISYAYINSPSDPARHGKLSSMSESSNGLTATTQYTYDNRGNQNSITDPVGRVTKFWFDNRDRLIASMTPDPDGAGQLLPILTRYDYDVFNNVIAKELINSRLEGATLYVTALTTSYSYDAINRVTSIKTQSPSLQWYLTNSAGSIARSSTKPVATSGITNAMLESYAVGNTPIVNTPDSNLSYQGLVRSFGYFNVANNEIQLTESNAGTDLRVSKITLDRLERITQSVTPAPGSGVVPVSNLGLISKNEFDNLGNITKSIDALNNATSYTYDDLNRIVTISEPPPISGQGTFSTTIGYTANSIGWSTTTTDPSGRTAIVQADMLGRTTNVSGTAQPSSSIKYWMDGNIKSTMDELQRSTNYFYDQRGRLTATETPPADASTFYSSLTTTGYTSFSYTLDSLVSAVTDPMNRTTNYQYDVGGRLEQVTQPDPDGAGPLTASFDKVVRDSLGNVRSKIDGRLQTTSYTQDAWFRNVTETDPRNAVTSTAYDVFGNVTSITDPLNNITSYTYNKLNQVTTETKGIYGSRTYSYDSVGNTKQLTDRNGRVTSYNYDNRYRLTNETWNPVAPVRTLSYTYDTSDRMTGVVDSDVLAPSFEFAYDARSQLQAERQYGSSYLLGKSVNFDRKFDSVGNEVKLEANIGGTISISPTLITFSGGIWDFRTNYAYDGRDRLTSITQSNRTAGTQTNTTAPKTVAMVYNSASQITDVFRYSSLSPATANLEAHTRNNFDGAGRMVSITHSKSAIGTGLNWDGTSASPTVDTVAAYFMNYDAANRVTSLASRADGFKSNFTYDNSNQATNTSSTQIAGLAKALRKVPGTY